MACFSLRVLLCKITKLRTIIYDTLNTRAINRDFNISYVWNLVHDIVLTSWLYEINFADLVLVQLILKKKKTRKKVSVLVI